MELCVTLIERMDNRGNGGHNPRSHRANDCSSRGPTASSEGLPMGREVEPLDLDASEGRAQWPSFPS
eukprot:1514736-Pleurochrysis_carterae.AAC.1